MLNVMLILVGGGLLVTMVYGMEKKLNHYKSECERLTIRVKFLEKNSGINYK